jgi:hypothetical protein
MSELEAYNAMMLANDHAQSTGQVLLTVLTGYLLITYFVGKDLTIFQVSFVNMVFLLTYISTWATLANYLEVAIHFREILVDLGSEIPLSNVDYISTPVFNLSVAGLITIGAFYFMWNVRHPKTE